MTLNQPDLMYPIVGAASIMLSPLITWPTVGFMCVLNIIAYFFYFQHNKNNANDKLS